MKSKINKTIQKFKVKKLFSIVVGIVVIGVILSLYLAKDAVPGNMMYWLDQWFESTTLSSTADSRAKAELNLKNAQERLAESKIVIKDKFLLDEAYSGYKSSLDGMVENVKNYSNQEGFDQNKLAKFIEEVVTIYEPSFVRTLKASLEGEENPEIRTLIIDANRRTQKLDDELFDIGVDKIENNDEFNSFASNKFLSMVRVYQDTIDFHTENITMLKKQEKDETIAELTNILNEARDTHRETLLAINKETPKETMARFNKMDEIFARLSTKLIEVSQDSSDNKAK